MITLSVITLSGFLCNIFKNSVTIKHRGIQVDSPEDGGSLNMFIFQSFEMWSMMLMFYWFLLRGGFFHYFQFEIMWNKCFSDSYFIDIESKHFYLYKVMLDGTFPTLVSFIPLAEWYCIADGSGSGGRISWDWNSTFSGDRIINHEVEIPNNWFDLLIAAVFMRLKLPNNAFRVLISWLFLWLTNRSWDRN